MVFETIGNTKDNESIRFWREVYILGEKKEVEEKPKIREKRLILPYIRNQIWGRRQSTKEIVKILCMCAFKDSLRIFGYFEYKN